MQRGIDRAGRIGDAHGKLRSGSLPFAEVPLPQCHAQFRPGVQVELDQRVMQVGLDRFGRNAQPDGDLGIGIAQADQASHLLFAPGKGLPVLPEFAGELVVGHAGSYQVSNDLIFRTAFLLDQPLQFDVEKFVQAVDAQTKPG